MCAAHYLNRLLSINQATQPSFIGGPLGDQKLSLISLTANVAPNFDLHKTKIYCTMEPFYNTITFSNIFPKYSPYLTHEG